MITVKNEQHSKGNSRRRSCQQQVPHGTITILSGTVWQFAVHRPKCNSFALSIIRSFNGLKNGKNDHVPNPVRNIYFSVPFRRASEPIRTHFGEEQCTLQARALARGSGADKANSGGTKPQKIQRERAYTENVTVRFDFRNVRRFSRNYAVFTKLRGFRGTTWFSRNYTVFTKLRGFYGTTWFSQNYTVFTKVRGFRGTTRFSRNHAVFPELHGFHVTTRFLRNYTVFAELRGFHGTTRFSRNYAVFAELHGFHGTTQFLRNYAVFVELRGFHETTRFSRNYTVFTKLRGFSGTTRFSRNYMVFTELHSFTELQFSRNYAVFTELHAQFSRNYSVFTELHGFHGTAWVNVVSYTPIRKVRPSLRRSLLESQMTIIMYRLPCTEFHPWSKNV